MALGMRRKARESALQVLYQLDGGSQMTVEQALAYYWESFDGDAEARAFADRLVRGTQTQLAAIDDIITKSSKNWRLERMARVDRNILRLAVYELKYESEIPPRVTINEAIEVAKRFGTAESSAFVNGILDRIAQDLGADGKRG